MYSMVGLGSEGMQTYRLASGEKGDLCGSGELVEVAAALFDGL